MALLNPVSNREHLSTLLKIRGEEQGEKHGAEKKTKISTRKGTGGKCARAGAVDEEKAMVGH